MQSSKLSKTNQWIVGIIGLTLLSRILGFIRDVMMGSRFGATNQTDAYIVANTIPGILFATVSIAIGTSFIPVYSRISLERGKIEGNSFTNKILNVVLLVSLFLCAVGLIFSRGSTFFIAAGFDAETLELTVKLTRIIFPVIIFTGIAKIQSAFLQSNGRLMIPAALTIPNNVLLIIALILSREIGIEGLAWFTVLGAAVQVLIQIPFTRKGGYRYRFLITLRDEDVCYTVKLVAPIFFGTAVQQASTIIDRILASGLPEGSISALNFSDKLSTFIFGIMALSVTTVVFPMFSELSAAKDVKLFKDILTYAINIILMFSIPAIIAVLILNKPMIRVFFERGAFDSRATSMTASALVFYSIGMLAFGIRDIINRAFFSLHDTKTPMMNSVVLLVIGIILNLILIKPMAHNGLALATSSSAIITLPVLLISLQKKIGTINWQDTFAAGGKSLIASIIMGIWVFTQYHFMTSVFGISYTAQVIQLVVCTFTGVLIYITMMYLLQVKEMIRVVDAIIRGFEHIPEFFIKGKGGAVMDSGIERDKHYTSTTEFGNSFTQKTSSFRSYDIIKHEEIIVEELNSTGKLLNVRVKLKNVHIHPIKLAVVVYDEEKAVKGIQFATVIPKGENLINELVIDGFSFILDGGLQDEKQYDIRVIAHYSVN